MAPAGREALTVTLRLLRRRWRTARVAAAAAWPCSLCPGRPCRAFSLGNCPLRPRLKAGRGGRSPLTALGEVSALSLAALAVCAARGPVRGSQAELPAGCASLMDWRCATLCLAVPCARVVAFSRPPRCPDLPAVPRALREEARGSCWVEFVNPAPGSPAVLRLCKIRGRGILSTVSLLPLSKRG